ncbi:MAG: hypothetical protein AAGJ46_11305 [Planctomycetota bacterium]
MPINRPTHAAGRAPAGFAALLAASLLSASLPPTAISADYFISTQADFDNYRNATFAPGDNILLERGKSFTGMFSPTTIGAAGNPITISTFGEGDRPVINNNGVFHPHPTRVGQTISAGVLLFNAEYTELRGLEVTNRTPSGQDATHFGIYVLGEDTGKHHNHIHIEDNYVHSVNEGVEGKRRGGIHVHGRSPTGSSTATYHDLRIVNNVVDRVGGVGIATDIDDLVDAHDFVGTSRENAITDLYIAHNWVGNTGRNTFIARDADYAVVEYNTSANSSRHSKGHSFFNFRTLGLTFQYNEAYGNLGVPGEADRGGFDADYNSRDTTIQYNYSHGNEWFAGIMKRPNNDVVIRYNLSVNDRSGAYFYGFENETALEDLHVYNNTHYWGEGISPEVIVEGRTPHESLYNNNLFYSADGGVIGPNADNGVNVSYDSNAYINIAPPGSEVNALTADPRFVGAGPEPFDVDMQSGRGVLDGYLLLPDTPYTSGGVPIASNGRFDFWGTRLSPSSTAIGAGIAQPSQRYVGASVVTGSLFPTEGESEVLAAGTADGPFGQDAPQSMTQTFQVDADFELQTIYLGYEFDPAADPTQTWVDIEVFEVSDVLAETVTDGERLLMTKAVRLPVLINGQDAAVVLDQAITLPATEGDAGYALRVTGGGDPGFEWRRTGSSAGSVYADGQAYEDGVQKLDGERDYVLALSSSAPLLNAGLPGDFNGDGFVDAADYTVWRDHLGTVNEASLGGAGDGLNGVDQADFLLWRTNFGSSVGEPASAEGVLAPEASTGLLMITAVLATLPDRARVAGQASPPGSR